MPGYTETELDDIQDRWSLRFPPDLVDLMRERRLYVDVTVVSETDLRRRPVEWIGGSSDEIYQAITYPLRSFLSSIELNKRWWDEWGERPSTPEARSEKLSALLADVPTLIPINGRRLPNEPYETGNPVISIAGYDAIYLGANLQDWLTREERDLSRRPWPAIKEIRFWSDVVRKNPFSLSSDGRYIGPGAVT